MKTAIFILFSFAFINLHAQTPKIVLQENFEYGIVKIHQSPDANHFLVEEGSVTKRFSLWDQVSKIMLGSIVLETGNGQGSGHINFFNNGEILMANNHEIIKVNLITKDSSIFIKLLEYPEYHLKFEHLHWNKDQYIIPTKIYGEKDELISDNTNNGRLLVYDTKRKKTILERKIDYEITEISFNKKNKTIALGTNQGDCILLDSTFKETVKVNLTKNPILFLDLSIENLIIANANLSEDHSFNSGLGEITVYNLLTKKHETIELKEQKPQAKEKYINNMYNKTNAVNTILINPSENEMIVNYAYTLIDIINLSNFKTKSLSIPKYESTACINFNKDSSQIVIAHGHLNIMGMNNSLSFYDPVNQKETFTFKDFIKSSGSSDLIKSLKVKVSF
jgi:hypothetical protein